jgi:antitoxin (DNA-binding transcriptional repressor) of toxin-antitoxin stability system
MKTIKVEDTGLAAQYVRQAQREAVVLTERGCPAVVLVGVRELNDEPIQLGLDDKFWKMIVARRKQPTISHEEMKHRWGLTSEQPSSRKPVRGSSTKKAKKTRKPL